MGPILSNLCKGFLCFVLELVVNFFYSSRAHMQRWGQAPRPYRSIFGMDHKTKEASSILTDT